MAFEATSRAHRTATIGADYSGSTVSLGVVNEAKVLTCVNLHEDETWDFYQRLVEILKVLHDSYNTDESIWLEKPWMRQVPGVRGDTGMFTARMAAFLEIASFEARCYPNFVFPQTWRKTVYGHGRPKDLKDTAVSFVKEHFGYDVPVFGKTGRGSKPDHNLAEAICIAHYGNLQLQGRTQ